MGLLIIFSIYSILEIIQEKNEYTDPILYIIIHIIFKCVSIQKDFTELFDKESVKCEKKNGIA